VQPPKAVRPQDRPPKASTAAAAAAAAAQSAAGASPAKAARPRGRPGKAATADDGGGVGPSSSAGKSSPKARESPEAPARSSAARRLSAHLDELIVAGDAGRTAAGAGAAAKPAAAKPAKRSLTRKAGSSAANGKGAAVKAPASGSPKRGRGRPPRTPTAEQSAAAPAAEPILLLSNSDSEASNCSGLADGAAGGSDASADSPPALCSPPVCCIDLDSDAASDGEAADANCTTTAAEAADRRGLGAAASPEAGVSHERVPVKQRRRSSHVARQLMEAYGTAAAVLLTPEAAPPKQRRRTSPATPQPPESGPAAMLLSPIGAAMPPPRRRQTPEQRQAAQQLERFAADQAAPTHGPQASAAALERRLPAEPEAVPTGGLLGSLGRQDSEAAPMLTPQGKVGAAAGAWGWQQDAADMPSPEACSPPMASPPAWDSPQPSESGFAYHGGESAQKAAAPLACAQAAAQVEVISLLSPD